MEPAMIALRFNDLRQHSDVLRSRSGKPLTVRFVEPRDADALQGYFRSLSVGSRYNRFLGAMSELPQSQLDHFVHVGEAGRFSVIALMTIDGVETIVGEARSLRVRCRDLQFRVWPVDRRPLARPRHRFGVAQKSAMPRRRLWRRTPVRRYVALQRRHDLACPQIRFRLHQQPRRLEAGTLRKTYRRGAAGHSLRQLAAGGPTDRASGGGLKAQLPLNTALRFSIKACTASR